jgi:hypothetical protein
MSELIGTLDGTALASGVYKDLPHSEAPLWVDASNVYFSDKSVQPIPGQYILTSSQTGVAIKGLKASLINSVPTLFYGTFEKLYSFTVSGGAIEVGSGYGDGNVNTDNLWSFARWSDWMLATNNLNLPQINKGSGFVTLGGLGTITRFKFFVPFGEYMLGVTDNTIYFCSRANVEVWTAAANNSAGSITPQDMDGPFMGGVPYGDSVLLFTRNSMHVVSYIGPPTYFASKAVAKSAGIWGINSVTVRDKMAYGHGPGGFFVTDGDSHVYIDEGTVHDDVMADRNLDAMQRSLVWHSKYTKQIVFWWPGAGQAENSRGYGYNYGQTEGTWAPRTDGRVSAEEQGIFPWGILGDASGGIYAENNVGDPVSIQDGSISALGSGLLTLRFGWSGFGQGGFGGTSSFTE